MRLEPVTMELERAHNVLGMRVIGSKLDHLWDVLASLSFSLSFARMSTIAARFPQ
jgi:hypothetical protein